MNKKIIISLLLIGVLAFGAGIGTYAWFTSQATSAANVFQAGTLTVGLTGNTTETAKFAVGGNLKPGDYVTNGTDNYSEITITNNGNLPLGYFANFELTGSDTKLAEAIIITNWENGVYKVNADGSRTKIWSDKFIENGVGNYPHFNTVTAKLLDNDGKISLAEWLHKDNFQMGIDHGWDFGALNPGYEFINRIQLKFDEEANDTYQGLSLTGNYKVVAGQVNETALIRLMNDKGIPYATNMTSQMNNIIYPRLQQQQ